MQQAYARQMNGYSPSYRAMNAHEQRALRMNGYVPDYGSMRPYQAENGDFQNFDNDFDGRLEPNHVRGYYRQDGTYTRGHYRAVPRW